LVAEFQAARSQRDDPLRQTLLITTVGASWTQRSSVGHRGGGESVATDASGRVYVANGQVFVYAGNKDSLGIIDVPERPLQLLVGGLNRQILFILTHHALYSVNLAPTGN
jgi:hypothetical protein